MKILILTLLITFHAELSLQQLCTVTTETTGKKLPDLPDQFQTHIEHNFKSGINNYTIELDEYYDFTNDRGSVVVYENNKLEYRYFLYKTDEFISVTGWIIKKCPFLFCTLVIDFYEYFRSSLHCCSIKFNGGR